MKRKLPSLALAIVVALTWGRSPDLPAQAIPSPVGSGVVPAAASTPLEGSTATPVPAPIDAQGLLTKATHAVDAQRSISAQMRHRISMFGHQLVGTGSYQQQGSGDGRMLRLDMKVKVADSMTSMQQVCDGRFLWIRRDVGEAKFLGRVDLRRIREAASEGVSPQATADMSSFWIMLGGLPQLLARVNAHFQFAPAREAALEGTPVWVLDGTWKPDILAMLAPSQAESIQAGKPIDVAALPEQMPTHVRVILRQSDHFPLHIEYLRQGVSPTPDQPPPVSPLLSMELFDIRVGEAIDPLVFAYKPGDKEVVDHTDIYLKNLGLKK